MEYEIDKDSLRLFEMAYDEEINEVDEKYFGDVKLIKVEEEVLVKRLNELIAARNVRDQNREFKDDEDYIKQGELMKFNVNDHNPKNDDFIPVIHTSTSKKVEIDGVVDLEQFKKIITTPPNNILSNNSKMEHSSKYDYDENGRMVKDVYISNGIPALSGVAYNEKSQEFIKINTCPGAGSCIASCYALKGFFIGAENVVVAMTRRLNFMLNHPKKFTEKLYNELKKICEEQKAFQGKINRVVIRWNNSGDFFSKGYLKICGDVAKRLKAEGYHIVTQAYTKNADVALNNKKAIDYMAFSGDANKENRDKFFDARKDGKAKKVKVATIAITGSKDWFNDNGTKLDPKDYEDISRIKQISMEKINKTYGENNPPESFVFYGELDKVRPRKAPYYNVIVAPGDGDNAMINPGVKHIILVKH